VLKIHAARVIERLEVAIREIVHRQLHRRGAVLGMSGGIDSTVCAALCVRALGKDRVLGLFLPEEDSATDSLRLGRLAADAQLHRVAHVLHAHALDRKMPLIARTLRVGNVQRVGQVVHG